MWTKIACGVVLLVAVAFGAGAASGSSPGFKARVFEMSSGNLTVQLPVEWRVHAPAVFADDPVHTSAAWWADDRWETSGTTLADLRAQALAEFDSRFAVNGWRDLWGWENGRFRLVGDTYVTLPVGRAWRETTLVVPSEKKGGWAARTYVRQYILGRNVKRDATSGVEQTAFTVFATRCGYTAANQVDECVSHNGQFAKVMHSIRFTS